MLGKRARKQEEEEMKLRPLYQHMGASRDIVSQVSNLAPRVAFDLGDPTALVKQETADAVSEQQQAPADDDLNSEFGDYVDENEVRAREERKLIEALQLKRPHIHLLTYCSN